MSRIVGATSITCVNCERRPPASSMRAGPVHDQRVARPAEVRADLLAPLERRVARPRPRRAVVRIHDLGAPLRRARRSARTSWSCISSVSGMPFCIVSSLNEPVIVPSMLAPLSPQIHRISVLSSSPELLDRVDHPTDVVVGVLGVPRVDLHLARVERLELVGHVVPRGERRGRAG